MLSPMAQTDPVKLVQELAALPECAPAVMVVCPDGVRRERVVETLLKPFTNTRDPLAVKRLRGEDLSPRALEELKNDLLSVSLFSPKRFFVIRDIERATAAAAKELAAIIETIPPGSHVVLTAAELKTTNPLHKVFSKAKRLVEFPPLEGLDLKRWVQKELKAAGLTEIGSGVVETIIDVGGDSAETISTVIERTALYLDGGKIEVKDVRSLFTAAPDPNEFALIDAIAAKNPAGVEVLLHELFEEGKNPFLLLSLLGRTYSNFLVIKRLLDSGRSPADVRQLMGMTQWVFDKQLQGLRRYSTPQLAKALGAIVRADSKLKNRSLGTDEVIGSLCAELRP
ncbi:MAG: hypothetical protein RL417_876 [Pseudomonadota bacterium]|jgi:DNA polymerase III delta subunit